MRNYFTFDGIDSRSFGVYISGQGTFKAPARSYDALEIPGRNGALLGIDSRLGNAELTYPAFIYSNFAENIAAFRAFLLSHNGYFKLKDSYHPDEFRLAYYPGPFEPDVTSANNAGSFDITFICKPQRYLESGQEVVELSPSTAQVETYTGNIVEIEPGIGDRVTGLTVPFIPIQDLNGYDSPWPGGGGKNILPPPTSATAGASGTITNDNGVLTISTTGENVTFTIQIPEFTFAASGQKIELLNSFTNGTVYFLNGSTQVDYFSLSSVNRVVSESSMSAMKGKTINRYRITVNAQTLTNATFAMMVTDSSASALTAFSPYSNICPISGRTGLSVYRTGKNLLNNTATTDTINGVTFTVNTDGSVTVSGTATGTATLYLGTLSVRQGKTYTISGSISAYNSIQAQLFCNSNAAFPVGNRFQSYSGLSKTATALADETIAVRLYVYRGASVTGTFYPQIELGSTASTYEPYNGNTYAVNWTSEAGTVYGGTLDVVTGVLTVDRASVDLGTLNWSMIGSTNKYFQSDALIGSIKPPVNSSTLANAICEEYKCVTWSDPTYESGRFAVNGDPTPSRGKISFINTNYASAADFKTAMSGIKLVYELATPLTYQLTPQEITLIQNALNYIWSNAGPVTVEVTEGLRVTNPTLFDALPFLRVYGTGTLGIGSHTITITAADEYTDIDCEMMDCFKGSANKNQYVQFSGNDFPTLEPGVNGFTFSGITKVEVKPRWWSV